MITLTKLANICHVSLSTASKAFSMSNEVNEETREMLFKTAKELGCFKKFYNAKYPKFVVAIMCPELRSRYYSAIVTSIQEELSKKDCEVCVVSTDFSHKASMDLYDYYNNYSNVDGFVCIDGNKDWIVEGGIPVVSMGKKARNAVNVLIDMQKTIELAADCFLNKGITDIGFIAEPFTLSKLKIFKDYMKEKSPEFFEDYIAISEARMEKGGYDAMESIFARGKVPRAIICSYDCLAIGAMRCIFDHGLKIPKDIAIIGINNNRESGYLNPPLSSIDTAPVELGKVISKAIMDKILGNDTTDEFYIEPKLVERESSKI